MKRFIAMLLAMCMLLSMAACTGGQNDPTGSEIQGTENTEATDATEATESAGGSSSVTDLGLPELADGYNRVVFFWNYDGDLSSADFWIWQIDKDGKGYPVTACDYGAYCYIDVPDTETKIGFIPRYNCSDPGGSSWGSATKDCDTDRFAEISGRETVVYLTFGDSNVYYSTDGGSLEVKKEFGIAGMASFTTIQYNINPRATIKTLDEIKVYEGEREIEVTGLSSLGKNVANGIITVAEALDLSKTYTVVIEGYEPETVVPTTVFDTDEFIANYTYDGDDLGAVIQPDGSTTFKVWAPTASAVVLNLFTAGNDCDAYANLDMNKVDKGVWELNVPDCGHGVYYTYTVTTTVGTQEAVDPYAKAAGVNGDRGMVVDLDSTDPSGWANETYVTLEKSTDATIWELHIRDFSNTIESFQYPGKYLAFTEHGLVNSAGVCVGMDYLFQLGVTHVHLLPSYDYAIVNETDPTFNWGYDPENYNVPEGSYSTDPYNGEVRINEYKQMVQSLHADGLGVIMDVVYNHTYDANSSFNKIVPYYYYRYNADGTNSSASGCGNDTASERYMFRKFMVDSVSYWAEEYKLDGFRFDLMGLHDVETMQAIEQAVHAINPNAIIYGEAWTMGATIDGSAQANQSNISQITTTEGSAGAVAVFNDAIRDGLKGSVFDEMAQGYINGAYASYTGYVKFGIQGGNAAGPGWKVSNAAVINYMSCHDNLSLWDKLLIANADNTEEERLAMNRVGISILMISQGTPFWQAGEEMLRSKDGDHNSYCSSDEINNIDWSVLVPGSNEYAMMEYYKGLIAMRKAYEIFRSTGDVAITFESLPGGGLVVKYDDGNGGQALVLINPTEAADSYTLDGSWNMVCDGVQAGSEVLETATGEVSIDARTVLVFVN